MEVVVGTWGSATYLAVLGVVAAGSFWLSDAAGGAVRLAVAGAGIGTLVGAVLRRRPTQRAGWWLVALSGSLTFGEGVVVAVIYGLGAGERVATVSEVGLAVLALLTMAAGLAVLGWRSAGGGRWDTLDTAITATGAFLLAWVFYIDRNLALSASSFATVVAVAIPASSLLVFAMAVKLAFGGALSTWSGRMLLLAIAAGLCGAGLLVEPIGAPDVPVSLPILTAWLAHLVLLGAAGVAPGFTAVIGKRDRPASAVLPLGRMVLFVLVALVAPVNIAVGFSHAVAQGPAVAAMVVPPVCGTLILLILVIRLALVAHVARRHADELGQRSVSLAQAMAKQDELQAELAYQAMHDPLTGLANRNVLTNRMETLRHACGGAPERSCGGQALMMVDLDGFKEVNDSLGHPVGDQVLIDVAHRLVGVASDDAVVARLGGDEFAMLLEETRPNDARGVAEAIRESLRAPYFVAGREVFLSASVGLLITEPGAQRPHPSEGLRGVDQALYDAKAAGRDRMVEFRPKPTPQHRRQASLSTQLRFAVARDELILHYQPMLALEDDRIVGVEALARWRPDGGEIIPPSVFIPMAEQTGVITDIDTWALRQACRDAGPWHAEHRTTLAVNVAGGELKVPTFAEIVLDTLAETGLPASALVLELKESILAENSEDPAARAHLDRLRSAGVRIAVDDFGAGRSSPSSLAQLPVDLVKIDMSFVQSPPGSASPQPDWAFIRVTLQVISNLRLSAIAEGVETGEQAATLRHMNCPYGQGYYFSPPLPADRIELLLRRSAALEPR